VGQKTKAMKLIIIAAMMAAFAIACFWIDIRKEKGGRK
jgi:hypothetical protein